MFKGNYILCCKEVVMYVDRDGLLSLTRMNNSAPILLTKPQVRMILDIIDYYNFMYWNGDRALADDPTQWDMEDSEAWKQNGRPISISTHTLQLKSTKSVIYLQEWTTPLVQ